MSADRWSWDDLDPQPDLPRALAELRDGIAPPLPNAGAARARRIEAIKAEIAACQAFIDDCDFMADDLKTTSCMGEIVPQLMRGHLAGLRADWVDRKRLLEAERDAKRGTG